MGALFSMESESPEIDLAWVLAGAVCEAGGMLTVSTEWFEQDPHPFLDKQLGLQVANGNLVITLVDMETE